MRGPQGNAAKVASVGALMPCVRGDLQVAHGPPQGLQKPVVCHGFAETCEMLIVLSGQKALTGAPHR